MKLYEISELYNRLLEMAENGADDEALKLAFDDIEMELEEKADNTARLIKQWTGEAEIIKAERERLQAREKSLINNIARVKGFLLGAMESTGKQQIKTPFFTISIRNNAPSVDIIDSEKVESWATKNDASILKISTSIDKTRLKEALQSGEKIAGAVLKQSKGVAIR